MVIAYERGTRLQTVEFLELLRENGYKIGALWGKEYSKEHFINDNPQINNWIVVDHKEKTAEFRESICAMNCFVVELPVNNPIKSIQDGYGYGTDEVHRLLNAKSD